MQKSKQLCYLAVLSVLEAVFCFAQDLSREGFWEDGVPRFLKTVTEAEISIGEVITLTPYHQIERDDTLNMFLKSVEWEWPKQSVKILSAEDIDYRKIGDQTMYLVTDPESKQVLEMNAATRNVSWSLPAGIADWPVDAYGYVEDNNYKVLITDKLGNKILVYNTGSTIVEWSYGGQEGAGSGMLSDPADAIKLPGLAQFVIADKGNDRVLVVDTTGTTIWQSDAIALNSPVDVEYIRSTDELLVTDQTNHRVVKINRDTDEITWQFGETGVPADNNTHLNSPTDADTLPNGNFLIADAGNKRIIEVDKNGTIVWKFHEKFEGIRDVDRLPDNRHLVVFLDPIYKEFLPARLGYVTSALTSSTYDLGRRVNYDKIEWEAETLQDNTSVMFQLRSANNYAGDLAGATWYGPTSTEDYYTMSGETINPIHNGERFFQFRAKLETTDPLYTPILQKIAIYHHFYNTKFDTTPTFTSEIIRDEENFIISRWKNLEFSTTLPVEVSKRKEIGLDILIVDTMSPPKTLANFPASESIEKNSFPLESITALNGVQAVRLVGIASTSDPSLTPILNSWKISWDAVPFAFSGIKFVDRRGNQADFYRATPILPAQENKVDSVDIILNDADQSAILRSVDVDIVAAKSGDRESVELVLEESTSFRSIHKIPLLISENTLSGNRILEVVDRDTLFVTYRDPSDLSDTSSDSILIVQNTSGTITIEKSGAMVLQEAHIGDDLFVRVSDEHDRNVDPAVQESIKVTMFDRVTDDEETLTLYEVTDRPNRWDTGEFLTKQSVQVVNNNNGIKNDGQLQTIPGHRIGVEYIDNVVLTHSVLVPGGADTIYSIYLGGEPYIAEIAPNPFFDNRHDNIKLRVASATGVLFIRRLEVYNLAGEKVRGIDGNSLQFDTGTNIPNKRYGIANTWWDLRNDSGDQISSGTYWLKVHADLVHEDTGDVESVAFFRKFVVVR